MAGESVIAARNSAVDNYGRMFRIPDSFSYFYYFRILHQAGQCHW